MCSRHKIHKSIFAWKKRIFVYHINASIVKYEQIVASRSKIYVQNWYVERHGVERHGTDKEYCMLNQMVMK